MDKVFRKQDCRYGDPVFKNCLNMKQAHRSVCNALYGTGATLFVDKPRGKTALLTQHGKNPRRVTRRILDEMTMQDLLIEVPSEDNLRADYELAFKPLPKFAKDSK